MCKNCTIDGISLEMLSGATSGSPGPRKRADMN